MSERRKALIATLIDLLKDDEPSLSNSNITPDTPSVPQSPSVLNPNLTPTQPSVVVPSHVPVSEPNPPTRTHHDYLSSIETSFSAMEKVLGGPDKIPIRLRSRVAHQIYSKLKDDIGDTSDDITLETFDLTPPLPPLPSPPSPQEKNLPPSSSSSSVEEIIPPEESSHPPPPPSPQPTKRSLNEISLPSSSSSSEKKQRTNSSLTEEVLKSIILDV